MGLIIHCKKNNNNIKLDSNQDDNIIPNNQIVLFFPALWECTWWIYALCMYSQTYTAPSQSISYTERQCTIVYYICDTKSVMQDDPLHASNSTTTTSASSDAPNQVEDPLLGLVSGAVLNTANRSESSSSSSDPSLFDPLLNVTNPLTQTRVNPLQQQPQYE